MIKLYEEMQRSLRLMQGFAESFEKELAQLPKGSLSMHKQNAQSHYYHNVWSEGKKQKYYLKSSSKHDQRKLQKLQRRRYIMQCLPILKTDIQALEQAVKKFRPYDPHIICSQLSSAYQGIEKDPSLWLPTEPGLRRWARESYDRYTGHPESLIHETSTGLMVRSKSESMIAEALTLFGVPFRYEQILEINGAAYAPDFTILHPLTRALIYWEHFGKMDDPDYVFSNGKKIMDYRQAGIYAGSNFLMTFEDKSHPLTMREIQDMIQAQLLR